MTPVAISTRTGTGRFAALLEMQDQGVHPLARFSLVVADSRWWHQIPVGGIRCQFATQDAQLWHRMRLGAVTLTRDR
jgi:hypothetical protein